METKELSSSCDKRTTLMDVAINLIWQSSYSNVGVAEICNQAGVTKGCFYHYFDSKAVLFYEASLHYWETIKPELDAIFSPSSPPLQQLDALIQYIIAKQHACSPANDTAVSGCPFFTSGVQGDNDVLIREASAMLSQKMICYYVALICALKEAKLITPASDTQQLARIMYQYLQGVLLYGRVMQDISIVKTDLRQGLHYVLGIQSESS